MESEPSPSLFGSQEEEMELLVAVFFAERLFKDKTRFQAGTQVDDLLCSIFNS